MKRMRRQTMIKRTVMNRFFRLIAIVFKITAVLSLGFLGGKFSVYDPKIYGVSQAATLVIRANEYENDMERDPQKAPFANGVEVNTLSLLFSGLVKIDVDGQVVPDLAQSWSISADYLKYTFTLDPAARFGNGEAVTSSDVVNTINRAAGPGSSYEARKSVRNILGSSEFTAGKSKELAGIQSIDDKTIEIVLKKPAQGFLYDLASPSLFIVDTKEINADTKWFQQPNGTGPYMVIDYKKGSHVLLQRKDEYYGVIPSIRNVLYIYQNNNIKEYVGLSDDKQYETNTVDIRKLTYLQGDKDQTYESIYQNELTSFRPWCFSFFALSDKWIFQDIHMRRAFDSAINREVYVNKLYRGDAEISHSVFSPGMPGYSARNDYAKYNLQYSASQSGKRAHFDEKVIWGRETGYIDTSSQEYEIIGQMVQRAFRGEMAVLKADPNIGDLPDNVRNDFSGARLCTQSPDPASTIYELRRISYPIIKNDKNLFDMYSAAEDIRDGPMRVAKFQEIEKQIMGLVPIVFTATPNEYFLMKPYVQGFNSIPGVALTIPEMRLDGKKLYLFGSMIQRTLIDYWEAIVPKNDDA